MPSPDHLNGAGGSGWEPGAGPGDVESIPLSCRGPGGQCPVVLALQLPPPDLIMRPCCPGPGPAEGGKASPGSDLHLSPSL